MIKNKIIFNFSNKKTSKIKNESLFQNCFSKNDFN